MRAFRNGFAASVYGFATSRIIDRALYLRRLQWRPGECQRCCERTATGLHCQSQRGHSPILLGIGVWATCEKCGVELELLGWMRLTPANDDVSAVGGAVDTVDTTQARPANSNHPPPVLGIQTRLEL